MEEAKQGEEKAEEERECWCLEPRGMQNGSVKGLHGERSTMTMQQNLVEKIPVSDETGQRKIAIIH